MWGIEDMENDVPTQMGFVGAFASQLLLLLLYRRVDFDAERTLPCNGLYIVFLNDQNA